MQDSSLGRDGPKDPNDPNSGTQFLLRAMTQLCPQATSTPAGC
jgi:hypothetical protein